MELEDPLTEKDSANVRMRGIQGDEEDDSGKDLYIFWTGNPGEIIFLLSTSLLPKNTQI